MEIYKQTDSRWSWMGLGHSSPYKCAQFGSECVAIAQALLSAGWSITPAHVIGQLTDADGFTDETFERGPGMVKVEVLHTLWPQLTIGAQGYSITRGLWGRFNQAVLTSNDGTVYDTYHGTIGLPTSFVTAPGFIYTFNVTPRQVG